MQVPKPTCCLSGHTLTGGWNEEQSWDLNLGFSVATRTPRTVSNGYAKCPSVNLAFNSTSPRNFWNAYCPLASCDEISTSYLFLPFLPSLGTGTWTSRNFGEWIILDPFCTQHVPTTVWNPVPLEATREAVCFPLPSLPPTQRPEARCIPFKAKKKH